MNSALKAESNELNIEKKIEILMIDFESFETFETDEAVEKSAAFIIDFEIMNGSEIIVIDLINRFFSHRLSFHFQSKIVSFINQSKIVLFIKKNINRA